MVDMNTFFWCVTEGKGKSFCYVTLNICSRNIDYEGRGSLGCCTENTHLHNFWLSYLNFRCIRNLLLQLPTLVLLEYKTLIRITLRLIVNPSISASCMFTYWTQWGVFSVLNIILQMKHQENIPHRKETLKSFEPDRFNSCTFFV